jgi:general nucleoside transport system ATP-binding protein
MSEFALQMRQISKTYGNFRANDSINFNVKKGTIHALAGENGAGKSTLMKILFGLVNPDPSPVPSAGIVLNGKAVCFFSPLDAIQSGIGMVQQHFALAGPLSALDNIILGAEPANLACIDRNQAETLLRSLLQEELHVPWHTPVEDLSVGMRQRVEILKLLFRKAEVLILDEPTAVLTPQEVEVFFSLLRKLKDAGRTIIIITHKLNEILTLCDEVTVIRHGRVTGAFSVQGLTKEKIIHAMIGRDIKPIPKVVTKPGGKLVEVKDLSVSQSARGSLNGITFDIKRSEIVGIAGVEGNGQQALVEALLRLTPFEGQVIYGGQPLPLTTASIRDRLNVGLISEDRQEQSLWLEATVAENAAIGFFGKFTRNGFFKSTALNARASEVLGRYDVKMSSVEQKAGSLSGGNQQKIVIAREINMRNPEFLIASQPTRGVDVGAIEFIHHEILALQGRGAGILLISSELEELCALSDRIIVLFEGRIAGEFTGPNYDLRKIGEAMTTGGARVS